MLPSRYNNATNVTTISSIDALRLIPREHLDPQLRLLTSKSQLSKHDEIAVGNHLIDCQASSTSSLSLSLSLRNRNGNSIIDCQAPLLQLVSALSLWHEQRPSEVLHYLAAADGNKSLSFVCHGAILTAAAAAFSRRVSVDSSALILSRKIITSINISNSNEPDDHAAVVQSLNSIGALAKAAPRALVPAWNLFLPPSSQLVIYLRQSKHAATRAAAASVVSKLLVGGSAFIPGLKPYGNGHRNRYSRIHSPLEFTPTAEAARQIVTDLCRFTLPQVFAHENHPKCIAALVKAVNVLSGYAHVPELPIDAVEQLISIASRYAAKGNSSEAPTRASALSALSGILRGCKHSLPTVTVSNKIFHIPIRIIQLHNSDRDPASSSVEEALVLLQTICISYSDLLRSQWDVVLPLLQKLAHDHHDVVVLHSVRVLEKYFAHRTPLLEEDHTDSAYTHLVQNNNAHKHHFHPVRSASMLCAEHILHTNNHSLVSTALHSLLDAAENDPHVAVKSAAIRALGGLPSGRGLEKYVDTLVEILQNQGFEQSMSKATSIALQSRAVWALASIVDRFATNANSNSNSYSNSNIIAKTKLEQCAYQTVGALEERILSLENGQGRKSAADTRATGLVRLLGAAMRGILADEEGISGILDVHQRCVRTICSVVDCELEAPKTRWNGCTVLGELLTLSKRTKSDCGSDNRNNIIETLKGACESNTVIKIRTAAARALLPVVEELGIHTCVKMFKSAREMRNAPRDTVEKCERATAQLVHDALSSYSSSANNEMEIHIHIHIHVHIQSLVDAVAIHAELPAYALNPNARLPDGIDAIQERHISVDARTRIAIRNIVKIIDRIKSPEYEQLGKHLADAVDIVDESACTIERLPQTINKEIP